MKPLSLDHRARNQGISEPERVCYTCTLSSQKSLSQVIKQVFNKLYCLVLLLLPGGSGFIFGEEVEAFGMSE